MRLARFLDRGSPSRHLAALCVLAIVFAFGVAGVRDYGIAYDQKVQHGLGKYTVEYLLGEPKNLMEDDLRYRGAWFELALRAGGRALGLTDFQHVYLSRYVFNHLFFLVGAFACYLLAWRLFQDRLLAMLAMLFLLCHPRLFGHSFFNSKDTPFLAMFLIALLFAHQALRSRSVGAHAGLGAWIGLVATVRPFAFLLVALIPLARMADFVRGAGRERTRLLLAAAALLAASVLASYLALPYLWGDPWERAAGWFGTQSDHTSVQGSLFRGELISTDDRPWSYVPVWFAITTPPSVPLLALFGVAALAAKLLRAPRARRRGVPLGFGVMLALSVLAPAVAVTLLVGNVYNDWRHLYFVYGPLCLLACAGLGWLRQAAGRRLGSLALAVAALGLAPAVAWIARLHPNEHVYFNFLVDRKTPERLRTRFDMDYWGVSAKEALEHLVALQPDGPGRPIPVAGVISKDILALPETHRSRVFHASEFAAYFASDYRYIWGEGVLEGPTYARPIHVRKVFGNTLYALVRLQVDDFTDTRYAADYAAALASPLVAKDGPFSVHWDGAALTYLGENCRPGEVEGPFYGAGELGRRRFFLHVYGNDLRGGTSAERYFHNEDFQFRHRGVVLRDGPRRVCMARVELNGYAVDGLRTGQLDLHEKTVWAVSLANLGPAALARAAELAAAREPVARGPYDVYWDVEEEALLYVRERCREKDRATPFFLHVVPRDLRQAPPAVAERGFANRGFAFATHGAERGDACVLRARLPVFPARAARTGQYVRGQGAIWSVDVALGNGGQ